MNDHPVFNFFPRLSEELTILAGILDKNPSEAAHRLYIRSAFAVLEGLSCMIRSKATAGLGAEFRRGKPLQVSALHLLSDSTYNVASNGKIERKNRCDVPFGAHFALGIRTLAEAAEVEQIYIQGEGWDAFKRAIIVRNRITHPKDDSDVRVSEEDFQVVQTALNWAFNSVVDIFKKSEIYVTDEGELGSEIKD